MGDKNPNKPPKKKKVFADQTLTIEGATDSVAKATTNKKR